MKKFVILLLTAVIAFSGCAKENEEELLRIEEDIVSERFGERFVRQPADFSVEKCEILKREKLADGERLTVRAVAGDGNKTVCVTGTYVITYVNRRSEPDQDAFSVRSETAVPQRASDFSEDELLLALKLLGLGSFSSLTVKRHSPSLLNGKDRYLVTADGENFEIGFTYSLKLGWSIKTAELEN